MENLLHIREEVSGIVEHSVIDTFNDMLGQNVLTSRLQEFAVPGPDTKVHTFLRLEDENNHAPANFCFSFDQDLLECTAAAFYPAAMLGRQEVYDDIACAVANIVGSKVKSCLNRQGFAFIMGLPAVERPGDPETFDRQNVVHVHFSFNRENGMASSDGVVVNVMLGERPSASCQ